MGYPIRMAVYVVGGGALLAWIEPRGGLIEIAAILALIGACAVADGLVTRSLGARRGGPPVRKAKSAWPRRAGAAARGRGFAEAHAGGHRTLPPLFVTSDLDEAEALVAQLRGRDLHPLLVTQRGARDHDPVRFEVRLPEPEQRRAHSILARFAAHAAER